MFIGTLWEETFCGLSMLHWSYGAGYTLSEAVEHFSLRFADR
jgi:hypothetical protein